MSRIKLIEPLVEDALINVPETRKDNFILYIEVLGRFIDPKISLQEAFLNHKLLGLPELETITRCRRKLQEKNPELRDKEAVSVREKEQEEYRDYAMEDKLWY